MAVQKSSQADVRQAGDEGQALSEKRDSARAELQKALRGQRAALDRLRVKLERLARGDASLASHARNHASDDADDEMGLKRFDADLSRFRAGQRAEFERLRADERAVSRELAKAAARFAAWDGDDADGVPPPPAAPGDAPPPKVPKPSNAPPSNVLFASNLPEDCSDMMLGILFQQYAGFKEVRMVPGNKGIAFVEFADETQASLARQGLDGFKLTPTDALSLVFAKR